jgi:hypothetical protein
MVRANNDAERFVTGELALEFSRRFSGWLGDFVFKGHHFLPGPGGAMSVRVHRTKQPSYPELNEWHRNFFVLESSFFE